MQNLSLPIDVVFPHGVIGIFIVSRSLMRNGVVRYLKPMGVRSFHQEVICSYVTIKQGSKRWDFAILLTARCTGRRIAAQYRRRK